jgi:predicted RecB family nuclease
MDPSNPITAAVFSAFLKCPTKAHLLAIGQPAPGAYFADIEALISSKYKAVVKRQPRMGAEVAELLEFGQLRRSLDYETITHHVDCETAVYDFALPQNRPGGRQPQKLKPTGTFVPVLFLPWDKPDLSDSLLLCFGALALSQVTGILADTGTLIYGEGHRRKTVKIRNHVARTRQIIEAIAATCRGQEPPPLLLNRHCAVCDFQPRCRGLAIERDDLSLLSAMTGKERAKSNAKGIFTITQLSYGYRPRRRKRARPDAERSAESAKRAAPADRNDHKLKALAIKKNQIHVVGAPSLRFDGVPAFLDVEGMPDRDFYYLVGLRFQSGGEQVERSFWADGLDGERVIWESCLRTLKAIGNAQIVSYGAYETRYLRQMRERYTSAPDDVEFVDRLIETLVNLVGCIYSKVYFPTFSNSLKEVGRYLGFEWAWPRASGAATPLLRRAWELGADNGLKRELIGYNMDDCRAAGTVADALVRICAGGVSSLGAVDVGSLEVGFQWTFGKFDSALPEFAKINDAAYWDYQRDRIYIRSNPYLRKAAKRKRRENRRSLPVNTTVGPSRPWKCPTCNSRQIFKNGGTKNRLVFDLRFFDGGLRRWISKYVVNYYKCKACGVSFISDDYHLTRHRYGANVLAYVTYNLIELHIPQYKLAHIMHKIFRYPLAQPMIHRMKQRAVETYHDTYEEIKQRLLNGKLIHADETHVSVRGKDSYVWVFTSMEEVIYIWSETRAGYVATDFLKCFNGVLVSDFYAGYDSIECPQQRCLIHLIRDLNNDLHQELFNLEIKEVVHDFAALLKPMIDTIDRFGLKTYFLRKHKLAVTRFYDGLLIRKYNTELARKTQERFKRNRKRLFTFLDYDSVPWNNNNAEHAIKSFADLRDVIEGPTTERGIRDYLELLSIYQTCVYREIDFLGFLRSGEKHIDGYAGKRVRSAKDEGKIIQPRRGRARPGTPA